MISPDKIKIFLSFFVFFILVIFVSTFSFKAHANTSIWTNVTDLPYTIASNISFSYVNNIYNLGGSAATGQSKFDVLLNTTNNNGDLSNSWTNLLSFPKALILHSSTIVENHVYVLGGKEENPGSSLNIINSVYVGLINSNGSIQSWTPLTPLPSPLMLGAAVVLNNHLYYIGGENNSGVNNPNVYVSSINSDGTIGPWSIAGTIPGGGLNSEVAFSYQNKIIVAAGNSNNTNIANVRIATVDSNGNISGWTDGPLLPVALGRPYGAQSNDKIFIIGGGLNSPNQNSHTFYTTIDNSGNLTPWITATSSADLTLGQCCGGTAVANNYIYVIGGYSSGQGYLSSVLRANINDILGNTPQVIDLNVPLIKQTASPWGNQVYDRANFWSPSDNSISSWGCALTSATMVLNYYGITKLPNGTTLDPGSLNTWLESQNDGYVDNITSGYVNWVAIARLSKLAKSVNNITAFDALEFSKFTGMNNTQLTNDLKNNIPDILEEPGHFIVAKGINGSTFDINDPYYNDNKLSDIYSNTYQSIGTFTPAHSDLSYIMLTYNPNLTIMVKDKNGNVIGQSFTQNPLVSDQHSNNKTSAIEILYIPKPDSGNYTITISSNTNTNYDLKTYIYDINGNDKIFDQRGNVNNSNNNILTINFDKNNVNHSNEIKHKSFEDTLDDIRRCGLSNRNHRIEENFLFNLMSDSRNHHNDFRFKSKLELESFYILINSYKHLKFLSDDNYNLLYSDWQDLNSQF